MSRWTNRRVLIGSQTDVLIVVYAVPAEQLIRIYTLTALADFAKFRKEVCNRSGGNCHRIDMVCIDLQQCCLRLSIAY